MNRSPNQSFSDSVTESMTSLKNTALNKIADTIADNGIKKKKPKKETGCPDMSVQDYIPVHSIRDGIVILKDGRYVDILEFSPVNFRQKSEEKQEMIMRNFANIFRNGPMSAAIMILSDKYYPNAFKRTIYKNNQHVRANERIESKNNYIRHIEKMSEDTAVTKRFFFVIEYEGDDKGKKSSDPDRILAQIREREATVVSLMARCGNVPREISSNRNLATCERLYYIFNRRTCRDQDLESRVQRIRHDYDIFNRESGMNKEYQYSDLISPKGVWFDDRSFVYEDGSYYAYLGVKADGWPTAGYAGWAADLSQNDNHVDVTIIFSKLPKTLYEKSLDILNRNAKATINEKLRHGRDEAAKRIQEKYVNNSNVMNMLAQGDDLYNVAMIFTVRAESKSELAFLKKALQKTYENTLHFEDCYLSAEDYHKVCMPFLYKPALLNRLYHNMLSSQIGAMYPFISFEINDTDGYLLGKDLDHNSLVIFNNFNKSLPNGHTILIGKSGQGKTFTEEIISGRSTLNGMRVTCICPVKGFEYRNLAKIHDGTFVQLTPGSKDCLNPLDMCSEQEAVAESDDMQKVDTGGYLAKKTADLTTWFKLHLHAGEKLSAKQTTALQESLTRTYAKFGITHDDSSLFDRHGKKKTMPIMSDWKEEFDKEPELKEFAFIMEQYTTGICKNLNGQTNIDLSNDLIVYDVSGEHIPEELFPAFNFLAFADSTARIKEDTTKRDVLALDEVWRMMKTPECAERVQSAIKLLRSYNACCLVATQELEDFIQKGGEFGKAILNNATFKLFLGMEEAAMSVLKSVYRISPADEQTILELKKGEALAFCGTDKLKIRIESSEREFEAYDTSRK